MKLYKYPRTMHFEWSPGQSSDDKVIQSLTQFEGERVILSEKKDGENTSMYPNYIHARSLDSAHHESRSWVKRIWQDIAYKIPEEMRICGENLYAQHSIRYENLESYFYAFSLWEGDECWAWDDTVEFLKELNIPHVPVLYDGIFDEKIIKEICLSLDTNIVEGAVLRVAKSFNYSDFNKMVAKYVRKGHVQTDQHWMHSEIKANGLKV